MTSRIAWEGAALFSFIPLVLFLYLQSPLGPGLSLALGLALMFGHRFIASPWMARHALERCLWCGRTGALAEPIAVTASGRAWRLGACRPDHREAAGRFLTFVARYRALIALGIFVPLALLLGGTLALALGRPLIPHEVNALLFRTVVALTVVGTSVGYLAVPASGEPLTSPFPLHNLFLLGIRATLWVFRLVGAWWLAASALTFGRLAGWA